MPTNAALSDRRHRQLDRSRARRLLRRPGRPHAPAAPGARQHQRLEYPAEVGADVLVDLCGIALRRAAPDALHGPRPGGAIPVRVVYAGDSPGRKIRLVANGGIEIHPLMGSPHRSRRSNSISRAQATAKGDTGSGWYRRARPGRQRPRLPGSGSLANPKMNPTPWATPVKRNAA